MKVISYKALRCLAAELFFIAFNCLLLILNQLLVSFYRWSGIRSQVYLLLEFLESFHKRCNILEVPSYDFIENSEITHVVEQIIHVPYFNLYLIRGRFLYLGFDSLGFREIDD